MPSRFIAAGAPLAEIVPLLVKVPETTSFRAPPPAVPGAAGIPGVAVPPGATAAPMQAQAPNTPTELPPPLASAAGALGAMGSALPAGGATPAVVSGQPGPQPVPLQSLGGAATGYKGSPVSGAGAIIGR